MLRSAGRFVCHGVLRVSINVLEKQRLQVVSTILVKRSSHSHDSPAVKFASQCLVNDLDVWVARVSGRVGPTRSMWANDSLLPIAPESMFDSRLEHEATYLQARGDGISQGLARAFQFP